VDAQAFAVQAVREAQFDIALAGLPCFSAATELYLSPLVPSHFVLAKHYIESFPHQALMVDNSQKNTEGYLLSPTCCYPVFCHLKESNVQVPLLITHKNTCFRREEYYKPGERQQAFRMREYILLASDLDFVKNWIEIVKSNVLQMLVHLGISAEIKAATDPFFNPGDFRLKFQANENLKSEFIFNGIAVGSVNLHLRSFSKSCGIKGRDGVPLYSACFGLGYDRVAAILDNPSCCLFVLDSDSS
jgi:hypothetical protein